MYLFYNIDLLLTNSRKLENATMTTRTQREIRDFFSTEQGLVDLMFEMGVGNNERDRIVDDGFGSIRDLLEQYECDIEAFRTYLKTLNRTFGSTSDRNRRVYFPPRVMSRFIGALYYGVICYYGCHMLPDFSLLTPDYAMKCFKQYENLNKEENPEADKEIELDIPDFKGASNWRSFKEMILMRLSLMKGKMCHPIDYIVDETERQVKRGNAARVFVDSVPITDENYLKTHTVHFGEYFKEDNKRVWNMLKSNLHDTPAYDRISEFDKRNDGRRAWNTLKEYFEGEDYKQRLQDEAFGILTSTVYRGESQRYNFSSYVNRHVKAHKLLISADYNIDGNGKVQGMDESTKIQHFKTGIKLEAGLEAQLSAARTNGKQRGLFSDYVSYLQAEVDAKNLRKKELKSAAPTRNVSKIDHESNKSNSMTSQVVDGKRVEARRYTKDEWANLNRNQRRAVVNMSFNLRKQKSTKNKKNNNKNIKSIQTSMKDDLIAVGDAIVAKISGVSIDDDEEKSNRDDDQESSDGKPTKRKVKFGGVGEMLAKRRRA